MEPVARGRRNGSCPAACMSLDMQWCTMVPFQLGGTDSPMFGTRYTTIGVSGRCVLIFSRKHRCSR